MLVYLDDIRLNAEVSGPVGGSAVVLLHALGTNLTIWDEVVGLLPCKLPDFAVVARAGLAEARAPNARGAIRDGSG